MEEIWKAIKGYEGLYEISNYGKVRSTYGEGRIRKLSIHKDGYLQLNLIHKQNRKKFLVHRLVALAFIPNPNGHLEVNHIDFDKKNNLVSNLEWCNRIENIRHYKASGKTPSRDNCPKKINKEIAIDIFKSKEHRSLIAKKYNITTNMVRLIQVGKAWKQIHK